MKIFAVFVSSDPARVTAQADAWRKRPYAALWSDEHCCALLSCPSCVSDPGDGTAVAFGLVDAFPNESAFNQGNALNRVARDIRQRGAVAATEVEEPFFLAVWNPRARSLAIARDGMGLSPGYYSSDSTSLTCSNDADILSSGRRLDDEFLARFVATGRPHPSRTIWSGVDVFPTGSIASWQSGRFSVESYWRLEQIAIEEKWTLADAASAFSTEFSKSIRRHLAPGRQTWADLSGGHDSASVAATAAHLARGTGTDCQLGGTVTYVDSIGDANESVFVDMVTRRYDLRNERFCDFPPWLDDGRLPPRTPLPTRDYPYYSRERQVAQVLHEAGAKYLLSGVGPDYYFPFTASNALDLIRNGHVREAGRFVVEWSMARRQRVWKTAWDSIVLPSLGVGLQTWVLGKQKPAPKWVRHTFDRKVGFAAHLASLRVAQADTPSVYQSEIVSRMSGLGENLANWRLLDGISVRHPFLDRRLIELSMSLPSTVRTQVHRSKPVMLEALSPVLPTGVLKRHTKGFSMLPRIRRSIADERPLFEALLRDSVLADCGVIEPKVMLDAMAADFDGTTEYDSTLMYYALSLETWLAVRSGRYPVTALKRRAQ